MRLGCKRGRHSRKTARSSYDRTRLQSRPTHDCATPSPATAIQRFHRHRHRVRPHHASQTSVTQHQATDSVTQTNEPVEYVRESESEAVSADRSLSVWGSFSYSYCDEYTDSITITSTLWPGNTPALTSAIAAISITVSADTPNLRYWETATSQRDPYLPARSDATRGEPHTRNPNCRETAPSKHQRGTPCCVLCKNHGHDSRP